MTRICFVAFLIAPLACWAHMTGQPHSIASGLLHPVTGIDHLLALLAVGWIAFRPQAPREGIQLTIAVLGSMLAGAALGMTGLSSHMIEYVLCISLILSGVMIVTPAKRPYTALLLGVAGLCHGFAHGCESPAGASGALFLAGMVASSSVLLLAGLHAHRRIEESGVRFDVRLAISTCLVLTGAVLMGRL